MPALFPMFLKLAGQHCLVVGAGHIAEQKLDALLASGADVRVVAPHASDAIRGLAENGKVRWIQRAFEASDLDDVALVIAATGDRAVNEQVFHHATLKRVLCNTVDAPEQCHFYYPAVVRRGDLQIAISTAGKSPALAQRLRAELEVLIGPEYEDLLRWLGRVRAALFRRAIDPQQRKKALHRMASRAVVERLVTARKRRVKGTL